MLVFRLPVTAIEGTEHVSDGLALTRQKDVHSVGTIAVRETNGLIEVILCISERFTDMHHGHFQASAKGLIPSLIGFKGAAPDAFEIEGIQEIANGRWIIRQGIEHCGNHALRMVAGPLVDDVHRLAVVEVAILGLGVVVGIDLVDEAVLQAVA